MRNRGTGRPAGRARRTQRLRSVTVSYWKQTQTALRNGEVRMRARAGRTCLVLARRRGGVRSAHHEDLAEVRRQRDVACGTLDRERLVAPIEAPRDGQPDVLDAVRRDRRELVRDRQVVVAVCLERGHRRRRFREQVDLRGEEEAGQIRVDVLGPSDRTLRRGSSDVERRRTVGAVLSVEPVRKESDAKTRIRRRPTKDLGSGPQETYQSSRTSQPPRLTPCGT
eukprot:4260281-Prymnesium_polylepis.1